MKMKARTGSAICRRTVGRVCIAASLTVAAARAETDVKVSKEISDAGSKIGRASCRERVLIPV